MLKYVSRTFTTSVIHGLSVTVLEDGSVSTNPVADVVVDGKADPDKATKALRKAYPNDTVLLTSVDYKTELWGMPVEVFKAHSIVLRGTGGAPTPDDDQTPDDPAANPNDAAASTVEYDEY